MMAAPGQIVHTHFSAQRTDGSVPPAPDDERVADKLDVCVSTTAQESTVKARHGTYMPADCVWDHSSTSKYAGETLCSEHARQCISQAYADLTQSPRLRTGVTK